MKCEAFRAIDRFFATSLISSITGIRVLKFHHIVETKLLSRV